MADPNEGRRIISKRSKSFSLASKLLPTEVRDDAVAVYAWCRRCDDAVDDAPLDSLDAAMRMLLTEADGLFGGSSKLDSIGASFQDVVRRRRIPRAYVNELLAGMAMDTRGVWAPSIDELRVYCFRVAGVVGLMMCHVLGVRHPRTLIHAAHLGMGMQLTNIARDVLEDWNRGRLYLPRTWLDSAAADHQREESLSAAVASGMKTSIHRTLRWAERHYESGRRGFRDLDNGSAGGVATAAAVYQDIGRVIQKRNCDPLSGRAMVSGRRKVFLAIRALAKPLILGLPGRFSNRPTRLPPPTDILSFGEVPAIEPPE